MSKEIKKEKSAKTLKKTNIKSKKDNKEPKKNLWVRFRIFCHGVKSEFTKVHWTSKSDLAKYSTATIFFLVFTGLFFFLINVVFALIQQLV